MPEIVVKLGDRIVNRYRFDTEVLSIGRARDNDIVIENLSVSRNHARIKREGTNFILTDMKSANGTLVNGRKVTKTPLKDNDKLTVGKHTLIFLELEETRVTEEAPAGRERKAPPPPRRSPRETSRMPRQPSPPMAGVLSITKGRQQGREFHVTAEETTVGRSSRNHLRVEDWQVSNQHFSITKEGGAFILRDLGSWRGTLINGRAEEEKTLEDGDEIVIGETALAFRLADPESLTPPPAPWPVTVPVTDYEAEEVSASASDPMQSFDPALEEDVVHILDESFENGAGAAGEREEDASNLTGFDDDEFAPFTEEELEALESDELDYDEQEEMESHRDSWELVEEEKKIEAGESSDGFSLIEADAALRREEEEAIDPGSMATMGSRRDLIEEDEEAEEEASLFAGPVPDEDPALAPPPAAEESSSRSSVEVALPPPPELTPEVEKEIALWEKAMKNRSRIIRKNAAKELKRLTGRDYDWKSEPSGN